MKEDQFLTFYDRVSELIRTRGCFRVADAGLYQLAPDTGVAHQWLDRIVALGRMVKLTPEGTWGQYEVYAEDKRHNR